MYIYVCKWLVPAATLYFCFPNVVILVPIFKPTFIVGCMFYGIELMAGCHIVSSLSFMDCDELFLDGDNLS